jgi:hypothetical protein
MYLGNGEGAAEVQQRFEAPDAKTADAVLVCNFDSRDSYANAAHGIGAGVKTGKGKIGAALSFKGGTNGAVGGSFVKHT